MEWSSPRELARRTALVAAIVLAFFGAAALAWIAAKAVLTILIAVVLAVLFDAGARGVDAVVKWPRPIELSVVFAATALSLAAAVYWGGAVVISQLTQLSGAIGEVIGQTPAWLGELGISTESASSLLGLLPDSQTLLGGFTAVAKMSVGSVTTAILVLFLAAFFAWEPATYKAGLVSLLPAEKRARVSEVLDEAADTMRHWMLGQAVSMVLIFVFTLLALLLVGMRFPAVLALQAGLLAFIPTIGPVIAGIVIVLAGASQGATMALYGVGVYALIQVLESNLITPLVQDRLIRLPPGLTLGVQLLAGALFGIMGMAFAVPLAAAARTMVTRLYIEDQLGGAWDETTQRGE
ncbi:MAG: AI-2E family transporter [Hyphomicrobiales bacterium]|nr:AI-2E family transporter [Hyphomicrobiales bacterium]